MRTLVFGTLGLVGVIALSVGTASAIQFGEADGDDHSNVGIVVFYDVNNGPLWRCSGTMVADDVFLTAAHCVSAPAAKAHIWFDPEPADLYASDYPWPGFPTQPPGNLPSLSDASGTPVPHPNFTGALTLPNTSDVGVVVLDAPLDRGPYATIAGIGSLDTLATRRGTQDTTFTVVGYGLQSVKPTLQAVPQRRVGTVSLTNLRSHLTDGFNLHHTGSPGKGNGKGSTCFGDSGGPVFLNDTNVIVGVTSFGLSKNCNGGGFAYRMDTTYAQAFLDDYFDLD